MENKKGIKVKAKDTSIIDNVVNFFKKDKPNQEDQSQILFMEQKSDLSPRSTTPRKKIFNKTPQKVGRINLNNHEINRNLNNRTMDDAYQITFNNQLSPHRKSNLSPRRNINTLNPLGDTQFNKLILDNSKSLNNFNSYNPHSTNNQPHIPQKTFLSENNVSSDNKDLSKKLNGNNHNVNPQKLKNLEKQIEYHKRLNQQLKRQNMELKQANQDFKKQNQKFKKQIQNLNKKLKNYDSSNRNTKMVQISHLDNPKSPFDKQVSKKVNSNLKSPILKQQKRQKEEIKMSSTDKDNSFMKQSIPILPDISYQYSNSRSPPKMQQMSLLSLNLKNMSHQSSFFSQQRSFDQSQNLILKGLNKNNDKNKHQNQNNIINSPQNNKNSSNNPFIKNKFEENQNNKLKIENANSMSPLMQKTYYDKTMKPHEVRNNKKSQNNQKAVHKKEQITFSKTIGYLKGDQPVNSKNPQSKSKNPFQQIATDSNKFLFKQQQSYLNPKHQIISPSQNSFKVVQNSNFKKRQWMMFDQSQSPSQFSNNQGSRINNSKINNKKQMIEGSKTYKFQDFQINQEQSAVDYF